MPAPRPHSRTRNVITALAAAGGALAAWLRWGGPWLAALAGLMAVAAACALFWPRGFAPLQAALDRATAAVLRGLTYALLGLVFAVVFIPGRFVLACLGRDPLARGRAADGESYWRHARAPRAGSGRFTAQF